MEIRGAVVVITGGGGGIGRALALRFAAEGARGVVLADRDAGLAESAATAVRDAGGDALGVGVDVTDEREVVDLVERAQSAYGPIDLFCSNAGIAQHGGVDAPDEDWLLNFRLHVMASVYAARAVLPGMVERGGGGLLLTASAAGLLTSIDSATYSVSKHGTVALAEWLAIQHGDDGVHIACLCPQGVKTPMTAVEGFDRSATAAAGAMIEPEQVADAVVEALRADRFLVLPHPEVADYERHRAGDRDRWLGGMRRLRRRLAASL